LSLTHAQEVQQLHQRTLYELSNHTLPSQSAHINVGRTPVAIGVILGKVYVANLDDSTVSVIDTANNSKIKDIMVGKGPAAIGVLPLLNRIYVANSVDNNVSVIDTTTNTKIKDIKAGFAPWGIGTRYGYTRVYVANHYDGNISIINAYNETLMKNHIKVGMSPDAVVIDYNYGYVPSYMNHTIYVIDISNNTKVGDLKVPGLTAIGLNQPYLYVANRHNNSISVIDIRNNTKVGKDIKVGFNPDAISINPLTNRLYVANRQDNTVSVIDIKNNTKVGKDIRVGKAPVAVGVDTLTDSIYVANYDDNTVSVIDGRANKVVAGVTLNVKPFNAGHIECDKFITPLAQQFYLWSGTKCSAKPNQGFDFVSWQENLKGNSTLFLKVANQSSFFDPILDFLHLRTNNSDSSLNITKFGSFTANFKALPSPIPPEYVATLFTVVATAFVGSWLTPTVIGWRKAKKQGNRLDYYHHEVKNLYADKRLDKSEIEKLDKSRERIADEYTRGKINKEQYDKLGDEISIIYRDFFIKEIDSLDILSDNDKLRLYEIIANIDDTYAKRRINNEYYTSLKEEISVLLLRKKIDSLNNLSEDDKVKLLDRIKNEISDAYAKGMINELHYSLLKEKLSNYEKSKSS
jgi:YVTN family beta-propeller protein